MKKYRIENLDRNIYDNGIIKIDIDENKNYYFEIGGELTNDIGEAVSMMMRLKDKRGDKVWEIDINNIDLYEINPEKSLYWLTGGHEEWRKKENYSVNWSRGSELFSEKFGDKIIDIIRGSKKLSDIRRGFLKYTNLPRLYEYALEIGIA